MAIEQLEAAANVGQATTVPLEGGHLVIVGNNIDAEVVNKAVSRSIDDYTTFIILVAVASEFPSRSGGGGGGEEGENGGELHCD